MKVLLERQCRAYWHIDCPGKYVGMLREIPDSTMVECITCGAQAHIPTGTPFDVEVEIKESDMTDKTYKLVKNPALAAAQAYSVSVEPPGSARKFHVPFISVLMEISADSTAEFLMPLDEAIEHGIVEEQEGLK